MYKDVIYYFNVGRVLVLLKEEGVFIIGFGSVTYNLRVMEFDVEEVVFWVVEFDKWLEEVFISGR